MKGKTLIIFDVDGTLVFSNKIDSLCFAETYESLYGLPFPTIDWLTYPHVTDTTIFSSVIRQHFDRTVTPEEMTRFQDCFVSLIEQRRLTQPEEFLEVPFAKKTVDLLLDDPRFVVGIGTGGWQRPATVKLNHVQIPVHRLVLGAADGRETREAIINYVIGEVRSKCQVDRIVYVGDAIWDVHVTRRMKLNFVGIRRNGDLDLLKREGSNTVLKDYSDYYSFVEAVLSATPPVELERI